MAKDRSLSDEPVRTYGSFTEDLAQIFTSHCSSHCAEMRYLTMDEAYHACRACRVRVTYSQLLEVIKVAAEFSPRSTCVVLGRLGEEPRDGLYLRFGEFCWCIATCRRLMAEQPEFAQGGKMSRQLEARVEKLRCSLEAAAPESRTVFLGGSCNPTTWRKDIAIPMFEKHDVSYYNPQVDDWSPDLMEMERIAKEAASVLLFVVDSETRAVASMVEAAYLAGLGRLVVLVVRYVNTTPESQQGDGSGAVPPPPQSISVHPDEVRDLNNARAFLLDIAEACGVFVFSDIARATRCVVELVSAANQMMRPGRRQAANGVNGRQATNGANGRHAADVVVANDGDDFTNDRNDFLSDHDHDDILGFLDDEDSGVYADEDFAARREVLSQELAHQRRHALPRQPPPALAPMRIHSATAPILASSLVRSNMPSIVSAHRFGPCVKKVQHHFAVALHASATAAAAQTYDQHSAGTVRLATVSASLRAVESLLAELSSRPMVDADRLDTGTDALDYDGFCTLAAECHAMQTDGGDADAGDSFLNLPRFLPFLTATTKRRSLYDHGKEMLGAVLAFAVRQCRWLLGGEVACVPSVFLGGSCATSTWRTDVAEPLLARNGVSFFNPQLRSGWDICRIPEEARNRDNSQVLLVCITADSRSAGALVEAAYSIGKQRRIVITIEDLPKDFRVDGESMTERAIKDYNRGRAYLTELCRLHGIPLYATVAGAVDCCISLVNSAVATPI